MPLPDVLTPERLTIVALLLGILAGGYRKVWVWGYQLKEAQEQRDTWQKLALSTTSLAERAARIAEDKNG